MVLVGPTHRPGRYKVWGSKGSHHSRRALGKDHPTGQMVVTGLTTFLRKTKQVGLIKRIMPRTVEEIHGRPTVGPAGATGNARFFRSRSSSVFERRIKHRSYGVQATTILARIIF
jgi:aspartate oxidase